MITEQRRNSVRDPAFDHALSAWESVCMILNSGQFPQVMLLLQELAGHDDALDLVGALVDLGDTGATGSFRR